MIKRAQFVGHCSSSGGGEPEPVTWQPKQGQRRPGRLCLTYPKLLISEFRITVPERVKATHDRH